MAREKKDGKYISFYMDRTLCEKLQVYAAEPGQTQTMAIERILHSFFDTNEKEFKSNNIIK